MERYHELKKGETGAIVSIGAYAALSAVKLVIGYLFHSEALQADGLNNTTDIVASAAVFIGLRISQKPPDEDHPYGHFRAETVASLIASIIMMLVGMQVLFSAAQSIFSVKEETPDMIAAWTAAGSAVVMLVVYRYTKGLAKKVNSQALSAAAADNKSDALVSIGTFIGIFASQFHLAWVDTVTAFIIGVIICKTAWDIFKESSHSLTDGFDVKHISDYKKTIEQIAGVSRLKDIKARYLGSSVHIDVVIEVPSDLNIKESHEIANEVERKMKEEHAIDHSHVHMEPLQLK
ncbi:MULTISPECIES: cation diffusion facilitator family transporter [Bacillus]|uniref:cation diffusion facilitator family transporter n=1 Tax=Bacillus TaxID=1386 RepID=UPI0002AABBB7|nr:MULTISPECIES: cation diffusion facilitator family transporter [Bacillus]APA01666.1 transporter [Bacillus velezensis]ASB64167.1 putative transporter YeaB [Bacillus velezensis]ASS62044.1 Cadmium, cobalt and zinc/H(+)-K(+) antiporter [Bacillus velezensis]ATC51984.1 Cadmium, cobalt and zinc/H(+)-K(+) antiporter [Bacillus velezensis]AXS59791.1 cation transporter [Bacillus velezensis]